MLFVVSIVSCGNLATPEYSVSDAVMSVAKIHAVTYCDDEGVYNRYAYQYDSIGRVSEIILNSIGGHMFSVTTLYSYASNEVELNIVDGNKFTLRYDPNGRIESVYITESGECLMKYIYSSEELAECRVSAFHSSLPVNYVYKWQDGNIVELNTNDGIVKFVYSDIRNNFNIYLPCLGLPDLSMQYWQVGGGSFFQNMLPAKIITKKTTYEFSYERNAQGNICLIRAESWNAGNYYWKIEYSSLEHECE